jgi:hypothetical protein
MLTALHHQSLQAHKMINEMTAEGGFEPDKFIKAVYDFTAGATDLQNTVHQNSGKELARDDRYLFLDRTMSLSVTTMVIDTEAKQALYDFLTGDTVAEMRKLIFEKGVDPLLCGNISDGLLLLARNIGRELGVDRRDVDGLMRNKLSLVADDIKPSIQMADALNDTVMIAREPRVPTSFSKL